MKPQIPKVVETRQIQYQKSWGGSTSNPSFTSLINKHDLITHFQCTPVVASILIFEPFLLIDIDPYL